jgi:hypothetical protein
MAQVHTGGMYLVFFSLHSVAETALPPNHGYTSVQSVEFCRLSVFWDAMTEATWNHWTYPLLRCGAFDYRTDQESRLDNPYIITAVAADLILLQEGYQIYCDHGTGVPTPSDFSMTQFVRSKSMHHEDYKPETVSYMTFVKVSGKNIAKFNVAVDDGSDETTIVEWEPCNIASSTINTNHTGIARLDSNDNTKIRFSKSGHYIIIGRVAGCLEESFHKSNVHYENLPVHLDICNSFGATLQSLPEVVSFSRDDRREPHNKRMAEYGHLNDVIYVEDISYLTVRGINGACFAQHGTSPTSFNRMATQSLTVMRLDHLVCVDRYVVSADSDGTTLQRALGGSKDRDSLFTVTFQRSLRPKRAFQCIVLCSVSSFHGSTATSLVNDESIIRSQLCEDSGCGSHCLNGVLDLDE